MLYDSMLLIESPIQILIVLTIALLVFGPKKLPEIGRQIGGALRELRKAAGDVSRSFSTDYEPESASYETSTGSYDRTASYYTPPPALDAPMDLSDYTIVGVTAPIDDEGSSGAVNSSERAPDFGDYTLTGSLLPAVHVEAADSAPDQVSSSNRETTAA